MELFITTQAHLEEVLVQELAALGFPNAEIGFRGVYVDVKDIKDIYRLNLSLSTASRVLLPIRRSSVRDDRDLYEMAADIDWTKFLTPEGTFWIHSNVNHPQLRHSVYAAQVVKDAICDQFREEFGTRPNVNREAPDLSLNLFIDERVAILSLDTSGEPLHMRGYRQDGGESPVSETLAAASLRMAGYTGNQILLDPMAGSGTFLVEAALIATKTPPGWLRRRFGFFAHPDYKELEWLELKAKVLKEVVPLEPNKIFGIEKSAAQTKLCKENLKVAGFGDAIEVTQADFRDVEPEIKPNFVIANPPYGVRMEEEATLAPLYRSLGDFLKKKTAHPATGAVLTGSLPLSKEIGLKPRRRIPLTTGGLEARLLLFDLFSGSKEHPEEKPTL